ncbi:hypothetical protein [Streptomyces sp. NPDC050560]|uniref:hypothetical protein n=1 Tax=Streptomyces sp. NPDC050560 TaxID=3365630 RepID=UPI0037B7B44E
MRKSDIWRLVAGILALTLMPEEPYDGEPDRLSLLMDELARLDKELPDGVSAAEAVALTERRAEDRIALLTGGFAAAFLHLAAAYDETDADTSALDVVRAMALEWVDRDD